MSTLRYAQGERNTAPLMVSLSNHERCLRGDGSCEQRAHNVYDGICCQQGRKKLVIPYTTFCEKPCPGYSNESLAPERNGYSAEILKGYWAGRLIKLSEDGGTALVDVKVKVRACMGAK